MVLWNYRVCHFHSNKMNELRENFDALRLFADSHFLCYCMTYDLYEKLDQPWRLLRLKRLLQRPFFSILRGKREWSARWKTKRFAANPGTCCCGTCTNMYSLDCCDHGKKRTKESPSALSRSVSPIQCTWKLGKEGRVAGHDEQDCQAGLSPFDNKRYLLNDGIAS